MEQTILDTIYLLNLNAAKLRQLKPGTSIEFTLRYEVGRYGDAEPEARLQCQFYDGRTYQTVDAASLAAMMDEVCRRLGFADRQALESDRINATLRALPQPTEV